MSVFIIGTLKTKYDHKNCTLTDLLNVVIDWFIPKLYEKYVELNVKCTSSYKGYNRNIPFYMHDRPKWIVDDRHD